VAGATLITGWSGLIGRWTVAAFEQLGVALELPERSRFDLLDHGTPFSLVSELEPRAVVHLAWTASGTTNYRSDERNSAWVDASASLAQACQRSGAEFYCIGTVIDDRQEPSDRYVSAKSELRRQLTTPIERGRIGWLRPHYVFDPAAGRPNLVAQALEAARSGGNLILEAPSAAHDFVHAADVGMAIATLVANGIRGLVDIGSGTTHTVQQVAESVGATWVQANTGADRGASTPPADIKILRSLGWTPTHTEEFFERV
jgi:nucleoside-diphosphate-sugar epimerase